MVSLLQLRWIKGVCVFRCNLPPALLAEWPGSFMCHCGYMGVERTPSKSQHTKLTPEKKKYFIYRQTDTATCTSCEVKGCADRQHTQAILLLLPISVAQITIFIILLLLCIICISSCHWQWKLLLLKDGHRILNMCSNLSAFWVHEDKAGTDEFKRVLT